MIVFRGTLVHCKVPERIEVLQDHVIGIDNNDYGRIVFVEPCIDLAGLAQKYGFDKNAVCTLSTRVYNSGVDIGPPFRGRGWLVILWANSLIQYCIAGTGYDRPLMGWLKTYTYPTESKFENVEFAKQVYQLVVKRTLCNGTTTASYYTTIHLESSKELCRIIEEAGQRAFVGMRKISKKMDGAEYYVQDAGQCLEDTKKLIDHIREMKNHLIQPLVILSSLWSLTPELMRDLGSLARRMDVHIQGHTGETTSELQLLKQVYPGHSRPGSVWNAAGILGNKTLMAHGIYLSDTELDLFKEKGVSISHCPNSNFSLSSGILDARKLLDMGIKIGLGTDVSGGYSPSMLDAMRTTVLASKALSFTKPSGYSPLNHHEALYMATVGGAKALGIDDAVGNFEVGKQFDALLIDVKAPRSSFPVFDIFNDDTLDDIIQKFFYLGDDRNILKVFIAGKEVKRD